MSKTRNLKLLTMLVMVGGLTACGAHYNVTKLDGPEIPKLLPHQGIYYTLPKTEIVLRIPVTVKKITEGRLFYEFEDNVKQCRANSTYTVELRQEYDKKWKIKYEHLPGRIDIFTRSIPDPNHRYRLDVNAEAFSSFSHTVEVTSSGLLSSAESTIADASTQVALDVAKSVASLAATAAGYPALPASADPDCADFIEAADKLDEMNSALEKIESKRQDILFGLGLNAEVGSLKMAIDFLDAQAAKIKKANKETVALTKQTEEESKFVLFGTVVPNEFAELKNASPIWRAVALVPASKQKEDAPMLPNVPGASLNDTLEIVVPDKLKERLKEWDYTISATPSVTYATKCGTADQEAACVDDGKGGYRYRIAAAGEIVVDRKGKDKNSNIIRVEVASASVPVAQFGPIAQLPSSFGGKEGNITLSVFTDTGAMKKITVGATPQSSDIMTGGIGVFEDFLTRRELKEEETADEELNQLTREKQLLELKKAIRDLKTDLGE